MIELIGQIERCYRDYVEDGYILVIRTTQNHLASFESLRGQELKIAFKRNLKKRSLNANSYYWVLLGKICEATGIDSAYQHNLNLRECGYLDQDDEGNIISVCVADTEAGERMADHAQAYHLYPTSNTFVMEGKRVRQYYLLRGSSTFNTKEMARLIEIVVDQANDLGIETATPDQIREYLERYKVNIGEECID